MDMLFAQDGTPWFIDWNNHLVRKVLPDQTVQTVVGWTDPIFPGDGTGDASEMSAPGADGALVKLNHPTELLEADDGAILVMAWHNHKLRRIDPETGKVMILAGAGPGFAGDGGPMANALFKQPKALRKDAYQHLYIGDQQNFRVRRIDADGIITTFAGNGAQGSTGDGGPATGAELDWEYGSNPEPSGGLAVADGELYVADTLSHRLRVIDLASGRIDAFAGTGEVGYSGDDGPALDATFNAPRGLAFGPDGSLYVADTNNHAIRAIDLATGIVRTVVGTGEGGRDEEDGRPAAETRLNRPFGLAFDTDGNLYVMDTLNSRILKVTR
jgi:streptogramin lyase